MTVKFSNFQSVESEPVSFRHLVIILMLALTFMAVFILFQAFMKYRLFIAVDQETGLLQQRFSQSETDIVNISTNINQIIAILDTYDDIPTESALAYADESNNYPLKEKPEKPKISPFTIRDNVFANPDNFHYIADYPDPRMDSQSYSNELLIKDMQFTDEDTDFDWSPQTQESLQNYLDNEANLPKNTSVLHMECRNTLCKVVLAYPHYRAYKTSNSIRVFEHSYPKFGMMRYQFGTSSYEPSGTYFVYYYFMRDTYKG